ncbi:hypothetical protein CAPTEDRAFT_47838, partial [Capitella teleta]
DYALENVFNADETGVFFRALPNRSLVRKEDPREGIKTAKERVTAFLACPATGEKLTPLVIGTSCQPPLARGFLPVDYKANSNAWMTKDIFKDWVGRINAKMRRQGRSILLFVDNCSAHPPMQLSNVEVTFFPPNTTAHLQPCDDGIIAALKSGY